MSKIREEIHEFLWVIPNHRSVVRSSVSLLTASKVFNITTRSGKVWNIQMGYDEYRENGFTAYIRVKSPVDNDDLKETQVALLHQEADDNNTWSTFNAVKLKEYQITGIDKVRLNDHNHWLLGDYLSPLLDEEGTMHWKVRLTFTFYEDASNESPSIEHDLPVTVTNKNWRRNMRQLLEESSSADMKIVCSDGISCNAHRLILSAQSSVFASLVSTDMREKRTGELQLPDIGSATMKILLNWMYTGELADKWQDPNNVFEIVYAAEKYELTDIKEVLDDQLGKQQDYGFFNLRLLDLAQKIHLKRAEARLLERVKNTVTKVDNTTNLFALLDQFNVVRKPTN